MQFADNRGHVFFVVKVLFEESVNVLTVIVLLWKIFILRLTCCCTEGPDFQTFKSTVQLADGSP